MANKISSAVVRRLPKYLYYLQTLEEKGVTKMSSKELSEITGFTASQIRQDLNHFGGFGQQGYGYKVSTLKESIIEIIGLNKEFNAVIVGFGHIGRAIYNYKGFDTQNLNIIGIFDVPEALEEKNKIAEVKPIDELESFLENNEVDILILTVPKEAAQEIVDKSYGKGIKGIWNFAPTSLTVEEKIPVENIQLSESLYTLIYYMGNPEQFKFK